MSVSQQHSGQEHGIGEGVLRVLFGGFLALVAIALVLCAVFVPVAFLGGITGAFYRQFALTIATATVISAFNALTLSPALAALLLRQHAPAAHSHSGAQADKSRRDWLRPVRWFFEKFNRGFAALAQFYSRVVRGLVKHTFWALGAYGALIALTIFTFTRVPAGFIPVQDMRMRFTVTSFGISLSSR